MADRLSGLKNAFFQYYNKNFLKSQAAAPQKFT
jgi:hypothetical protein